MGRIKSIEIDNFKSYRGNHVVGPFDSNFTAVIGPNGAGKSNLMDAVSFVLGVHSKDLRGGVLQDLIYKMEGQERPDAASVSIVFDTEDDANDLMDSEIVFTRRVTMKGSSQYSINGSNVSHKEYLSQLDDLGVVVKAKNFLVFQGDVTSIANKSPAELTKFFEKISGSEDFKAEYDDLKGQKAVAERALEDLVQQRKAISQEKKIIEKQKREAEDFHTKTEELAKQRQQLTLWQLNHAVHRLKEAQTTQQASESERSDLQSKIDDHSKELAAYSSQLGAKKKILLKKTKEVRTQERDHKSKRLKVSEAQKQVAATRDELEADRRLAQQLEGRIEKQQAKLEKLRAHVREVEADRDALDLEIVNDAQNDGNTKLNLTATELAEYNDLKAEATRKSAALMQKSADLSDRVARLRTKKEEVEREETDLRAQREIEVQELARNKKSITVAHECRAKDEGYLETITASISELEQKLRDNGKAYEAVIGKMAAANEKLSTLMDTRLNSSLEEKKQRNLDLLQRQFRGVCGRLCDIVKPTQRKYNLAVSTALSKNMDAIVVERKSTAIEMAQFLSSNRAMLRETILPLDTLDPPQVKERLRQLGGTRKLVADVMTFDTKFTKAVEFACANVVLCETFADARKLRFQERIECKVVTIDGSIISMANTMSGGKSNAAAAKAGRWDMKESEKLKRQLRDLLAERMDIEKQGYISQSGGSSSSSSSSSSSGSRRHRGRGARASPSSSSSSGTTSRELESQKAQREALVSKIKNLKEFAQKHEDKVRAFEKRIAAIDASIAKKIPQKEKIQGQIAEVESQIEELDEKVAAVGRAVFNDFGARLGIADIHDFHERVAARQNEQGHRRKSILENLSKSMNGIKYDEAKLADSHKALKRISDSVLRHERRLRKFEVSVTSSMEQLQACEEKLQTVTEAEKTAKAELKEVQATVKAQRAARDALIHELEELVENTSVAVERAELLQTEMHEILQRAQVENIHIPTVDDRDRDSESGAEASSSSATSGSQDELGRLNTTARRRQHDMVERIDFEELEDRDIVARREDYDSRFAQWEASVKTLAAELDEMQPNLRAAELFKDVLARIKSNDEDYSAAKDEFARVSEAFEKVRSSRRAAFMRAFSHVSDAINGVYEELTRDAAHPHGGSASLSLIGHAMDPFLGGVKYIASAPSKRFRQIGSLSGGEQTMAALALLFSVHSFRPSPFYVMDEIDAALDNSNVKKVADYIKNKSKNFQCLVISLKDLFYSEADALVGIYRDREQDCSKSLTFDLSRYESNV